MKCTICNEQEAIIHIQEQSNLGTRNIHLCLQCAAIKGLNLDKEELNDFFYNFMANIFDSLPEGEAQPLPMKENLFSCPACDTPLESITRDGIAGCDRCFTEFQDFVDLAIFGRNNSLEYKGKLPKKMTDVREYRVKIEDLRRRLDGYLAREDYSNAAVVRDEIKELRGKRRLKRKK